MMNEINWIVDELLTENQYNSGFPSLADAAKELGHNVYITKYVPFSTEPDSKLPYLTDSCVVTHGTIQFCKQIMKKLGHDCYPGMYFGENVKNFSKFSPHIGEHLLNDDFYILPYGEFVRRKLTNVFIKPESGLKEFVGQVFEGDYQKLSPWGEIDPTTLVVISEPKDIKAEFRYIICNKQVVTGSEYRWDNILDVRVDTHPECDKLAEIIAKADWQADRVYVCDIALLEKFHDGNFEKIEYAKVIELNAFSSSGLYACDTYKIVEAVSKEAYREFIGDD